MKILLIDIRSECSNTFDLKGLEKEFTVEYTASAPVASEKIHLYEYDCIILYCSVAGISITAILAEITRTATASGLIILSAENIVAHKIEALNNGADDYLTVPYHEDELNARILAVVRRKKFNARDKVHFGNMVIDLVTKEVFIWNVLLVLTPTEYDILLYLIMNHTKTVSPAKIADYLWGEEADTKEISNLLVTHIKNLRKKFTLAKAELEIKNSYGIGYKIIEL